MLPPVFPTQGTTPLKEGQEGYKDTSETQIESKQKGENHDCPDWEGIYPRIRQEERKGRIRVDPKTPHKKEQRRTKKSKKYS